MRIFYLSYIYFDPTNIRGNFVELAPYGKMPPKNPMAPPDVVKIIGVLPVSDFVFLNIVLILLHFIPLFIWYLLFFLLYGKKEIEKWLL